MVTSNKTITKIVEVLLKYVDRDTAIKIARDLHNEVPGNKSVIDTFARVVEYIEVHHD